MGQHHPPKLAMLKMVEGYTQNFPRHSGKEPLPSKDVVLLTGITGALGLAYLVQSTQVEHIYALNRKNDGAEAFIQR